MDNSSIIQRLKDPVTRETAFSEIVSKFGPTLYNQIRRIVQYHDDANDVLQNTFLKAWTGIDSFRGDSLISTWLYRIAINESLLFLQRSHTNDSLNATNEETLRTLESDPYFDGEKIELLLQKAIATLPDKQRIVFNLRYFEDMKYETMSQLLDTSVGALKASYHIAVKKIEEYFKEQD